MNMTEVTPPNGGSSEPKVVRVNPECVECGDPADRVAVGVGWHQPLCAHCSDAMADHSGRRPFELPLSEMATAGRLAEKAVEVAARRYQGAV